jgi:hypothetical protein
LYPIFENTYGNFTKTEKDTRTAKKTSLLFVCIVLGVNLLAQYHVRFIVQENLVPVHDSIYITGYFNNGTRFLNS